ncbi:MAG: MmcQ/YjbR family DNA-binding protein [Dehalococcoidia bacterium]|nr:MmcQ/YjbR family DNA-binding protein [Dehalococcoidia bacterium]
MPAPRRPATRAATASLATIRKRRDRVTRIVEGYPESEATDRYENEHRSLEVGGKRLGYFLVDHFGDDGRSGLTLKAAPGVQETLVEEDPDTFWVPAFVGRHGWLGIRLDLEEPDWEQVADFIRDAWLLTAPRRVRNMYEAE